MKKWLIILIALLIAITGLLSYAVYAATTVREFPVEVNIITGTKDLVVYIGPDYSSPVIGMKIDQLKRGSPPEVIDFRVKNVGVETLTAYVRTNPATVPWGTITFSKTYLGTMLPNDVVDFSMNLTVPVSAQIGSYDFTLEFYEQ